MIFWIFKTCPKKRAGFFIDLLYKRNLMHWFFSKEIRPGHFVFGKEESKHIVKVLRLGVGDEVFITDGQGQLHAAEIIRDDFKNCEIFIGQAMIIDQQRSFYLHIALAPTKNLSRLEWFVEKATEFGIDEISPLHCAHSERINLKSDRLEKIAISAIKQSQKVKLPKINQIINFMDFISKPDNGTGFIAYVDNETCLPLLATTCAAGQNVTVLIGPEGDFSKGEISAAIEAGYTPISLGKNRLRTETAALAACFTINLINQQQGSEL
jgi:16S rRNA (uracil1498-N3)-methyltransferase